MLKAVGPDAKAPVNAQPGCAANAKAPVNAQPGGVHWKRPSGDPCDKVRHLGKIPANFYEKFAALPKKPCPLKGLRAYKAW